MLNKMSDRRLPIRAGDPEHLQRSVREMIKALRRFRESPPDIRHLDISHACRRATRNFLGDNGHRPTTDGLVDKSMPVCPISR